MNHTNAVVCSASLADAHHHRTLGDAIQQYWSTNICDDNVCSTSEFSVCEDNVIYNQFNDEPLLEDEENDSVCSELLYELVNDTLPSLLHQLDRAHVTNNENEYVCVIDRINRSLHLLNEETDVYLTDPVEVSKHDPTIVDKVQRLRQLISKTANKHLTRIYEKNLADAVKRTKEICYKASAELEEIADVVLNKHK